MIPIIIGASVRGEIETFKIHSSDDWGRLVTLRGADGRLWTVKERDIGIDNFDLVVGEGVYDHPAGSVPCVGNYKLVLHFVGVPRSEVESIADDCTRNGDYPADTCEIEEE